MSDKRIHFCCLSCNRTSATEAIVATAEKTMEDIFSEAFDLIRSHAKGMGIEMNDELKAKMLKMGAEHNLFPPDPVAEANKRD